MQASMLCTIGSALDCPTLACRGIQADWRAPLVDAGIGSRIHDVYGQRGSKALQNPVRNSMNRFKDMPDVCKQAFLSMAKLPICVGGANQAPVALEEDGESGTHSKDCA